MFSSYLVKDNRIKNELHEMSYPRQGSVPNFQLIMSLELLNSGLYIHVRQEILAASTF